MAQSKRVTEHHYLSTIVDKNEYCQINWDTKHFGLNGTESGWISTILIHLETFLLSCACAHRAVRGFYGSFCQSWSLTWFDQQECCDCCPESLLSAGLSVSYLGRPCRGSIGTIPWCHWRPRHRRLSPPGPGDCPTVAVTRSLGTAYSTWSASSAHWWTRCLSSCHLVLPVKITEEHSGSLTAACWLGSKEWTWKPPTYC